MKKQISNKTRSEYSNSLFEPNLIDFIKVKSIFSDDYLDCELTDTQGVDFWTKTICDTATIGAYLHVSIYSNRTSFYTGEDLLLCVDKSNPGQLEMFHYSLLDESKYEIRQYSPSFSPKLDYPKKPSTMLEFEMMINGYLTFIEQSFEYLQLEHNEMYSNRLNQLKEFEETNSEADDDLPF